MNDDLQAILGLLDDIDNAGHVSNWESGFIDSMLKLTDRGEMPNELQIAKIRQIHRERCA